MIRCNLSVLLAERNLKISRLSTMTGISRTTLTSLTNNYSQGIQFDTINTICNFLNIKIDQLISYVPVDIKVRNVFLNDYVLNIELTIVKNTRTFNCSLTGDCYTFFEDGKLCGLDISIKLLDEGINFDGKDLIKENSLIIESFNMLSAAFRNDIENQIETKIISQFDDGTNVSDSIGISFTWPNDLVAELN